MSGEYQASMILVFKAEKRKPQARDIGQDGGHRGLVVGLARVGGTERYRPKTPLGTASIKQAITHNFRI